MREELPNFAVCPAFTGRFGSPDTNGLVKLPSGSGGLYHCKRSLTNWQSKLDDEKYKWWSTYMAEKNIKPVMVSLSCSFAARAKRSSPSLRVPRFTMS